MENREQLVKVLKEWFDLEREIAVLHSELKTRKLKKKQMAESLVGVMQSNDIDAFDVAGGRIVHRKTKSKAAITKKSLVTILSEWFKGSPKTVEELSAFIHSRREERVTDTIQTKFDT